MDSPVHLNLKEMRQKVILVNILVCDFSRCCTASVLIRNLCSSKSEVLSVLIALQAILEPAPRFSVAPIFLDKDLSLNCARS